MASGPHRDIEVQAHAGRTPRSENWFHTKRELSFVANEEYTNASTGETANILISNPDTSGKSAVVTTALGNPSARSIIRVYDGFDTDPAGTGTVVDVQNNLLDTAGEGETDVGEITAERGVTVSGPVRFFSTIKGGGVGSGSHADVADILPFIIEPGRRVVIEVEKLASGDDDVVINANWYEKDKVYSTDSYDFGVDEV